MRYDPDTSSYSGSATDLANHARCEHLTQLTRARELAITEGREERTPPEDSLAARKGREFEATIVAALRRQVTDTGGRFVDLGELPPHERWDARDAAMRDGIELIAQAPLRAGSIFGYADLLERVGTDLPARYEPVEVKFARTVKPAHVLQVSAYADALAELQGGVLPARVHVITGDGERHTLPTTDHVDYVRGARSRFADALALDLDAELAHVPEPVEHCAACDFRAHCAARREEVDHLSLVARIRSDQRQKLVAQGIDTLEALATTQLDKVPGIGAATLEQLRSQASLQLEARSRDLPGYRFRVPRKDDLARRGFALLPEPDPLDVFFDFEGYPYHEGGDGLEYLWGWTHLAPDGSREFSHLWADDRDAEDAAFEAFVSEVERRRLESPGMHVFHYAPYEITALSRIARRHPDWMDRLDELLRAGVFVDLYAVVRQTMLVGTASYSIKQLEPLYGVSRAGDDLADGGASIEVYEEYLLTDSHELRATIVDYNRVDCDSTLALRDWLLERRAEARELGIEWVLGDAGEDGDEHADEDDQASSDNEEPHADVLLRERLEAVAEDEAQDPGVRTAARLLSAMPGWGWRIKREFLGDLYGRRHDRDTDDYVREPRAIGGLELVQTERPARAGQGTLVRTYRFPEQVTLLRAEDHKPVAYDPETAIPIGTIDEVDVIHNRVKVRTTQKQQAYADRRLAEAGERTGRIPTSLVGLADIRHGSLEDAARRVAHGLLHALETGRDPFDPAAPHAAALSMLARRAPRVTTGSGPEALGSPPEPGDLAELVRRLEGSHVVVQGPPGTGKTYTSARLVVDLVESGMRVGITSNSHAAIRNVLRGIEEYRIERASEGRPFELSAMYAKYVPGDFEWLAQATGRAAQALLGEGDIDVVAGTAWQFAKGDVPVDVMLVDEAGQLSLLLGTAVAACARRVVLVGDPQQLPQPSSVSHPHGCDASVLEHVFDGAAVLPQERSALLSVTRRMHPRVSEYISESYYEGRLDAHPDTSAHGVAAPMLVDLPRAGTHLLEVMHQGNRSTSVEEVDAIVELVRGLLDGGRVVAKAGEAERDLRPDDIIVVAPYNAQRHLLEVALQEATGSVIRVGTVDKFQGREAPVAIVSMTASSREDLPRGLEFLLDPHRLNVAISRARALSIVVASPALLATSAATLREMRLLNDLARFARTATGQSSS